MSNKSIGNASGYNEKETASGIEAVSFITEQVSLTLQLLHQHRLQGHRLLLFQLTNHVRSRN